jgi:4-hydroxybenzoate polyprenyltransferase
VFKVQSHVQNTPIVRFTTYLRERFPLQQFVPLALLFGTGASLFSQTFLPVVFRISNIFLSFLVLFLFLFRLRLFDEFKDYDHDKKYYPNRPVPRGLISLRELKVIVLAVSIIELFISIYLGFASFVFFILAFFYSLLLLREFFVKKWLKNHFTIYITVHEILCFFLFYYLYSVNIRNFDFAFRGPFFIYSAFLTLSFFILEVSRKIRPSNLEIPSRDTYTAQYGISGAVKLITVLATIAVLLAVIVYYFEIPTILIITIIPAIFGLFYLIKTLNRFKISKSLEGSKRVFSSSITYVVLLNLGLILALWLKK